MLEKLPRGLGRALSGVRSELTALLCNDASLPHVPAEIEVTSSAFANGAALPARCTADGPGSSPPLAWTHAPERTAELMLLIEDPDAPLPHPLVHAIAWGLRGRHGAIAEGALSGASQGGAEAPLGRNSYLSQRYLPPDPPTGHGPHRYCFELFALDAPAHFESTPGRSALLAHLARHAIAKGLLIGTYERA